MPLTLRQLLWIWTGIRLLSVSWWLYPYPVPGLNCWWGFCFLSGVVFPEVHHFVALPQPNFEMYTRLPTCSSTSYGTWQFCFSRLSGTYCCPEWCHWVSLSVIHGNLGGLPLPETQPQIWQIMSWGQQVSGTHQLPSSLGKVCLTLLLYPMTAQMNINLPYFLGLRLHLHLSGIPISLLSSSCFHPQLFPPSLLPPKFWTVTCLHLSAGLGYDVGGIPSSAVPPCYS